MPMNIKQIRFKRYYVNISANCKLQESIFWENKRALKGEALCANLQFRLTFKEAFQYCGYYLV